MQTAFRLAPPDVPLAFLPRPGGRIAYQDTGGPGPVVLCVPGMGDLRSGYRLLVPALAGHGLRVLTLDLRGHGASDTGFPDVSAAAVGSDVVALIDALGVRGVTLVGNSMGGAAIVWAAAERPAAVRGLVLLDPFVRDVPVGAGMRLAMWLMKRLLRTPWGPRLWGSYYRSLHVGLKPADLNVVTDALVANLRQPGRMAALLAMLDASKASCEARIAEVGAPAVVVMGTRDPDFPDPLAEARLVADRLHAELVLAQGAGHYPQVEQPELVAGVIERLARAERS